VKRILSALSIFAMICLLAPISARADFTASDWESIKAVQVPAPADSGYAFFAVDAEIYDGSADGLKSLRIIDAASHEVPYQIRTQAESESREEFSPKFLNNSYVQDKFNSFGLDLGDQPPSVNRIDILTTSENFTRRASVEGSSDQTEWHMLTDEAYIFNFTRHTRSEYLHLEFPLSNFRYLRVKIFDDGTGPLKISGAKTFKVQKIEAETETWPLTIIEKTENEDKKTTEISLDAQYRALPIREMELNVASHNYHRTVAVHSTDDREEWISLGSGIIFNYDLPQFKKTNNRVAFRENSNDRYFKLVIHNYDDEPLDVRGATGIGLVRGVIFPLNDKLPYTVFFGNQSAQAPQYDLAHRIPYIESDRLPRCTLGPRVPNPSYVEKKPVRPWSEEHAWLLWAIMAAVILFLAYLIFNLTQKTRPENHTG